MTVHALRGLRAIIAGTIVVVGSGCATTATLSGDPGDPWEATNRTFYAFNDALDQAVLEPVANLYLKLPGGLRDSIHNFLDNAAYPGTVLNQFLQAKFEPAMEGTARFVFNTTLGIGGLFDVSTGFGLERKEEDFGQTLAVWGVDQGAYLYVPFLGPYTARNTPDEASAYFTNPFSYISTLYLLPVTFLNLLNDRANLLEASEFVDEATIDPYSFIREAYLQQRRYLIHDGNPPSEGYDDIFTEGLLEDDPKLVIE